MSLRHSTPTHFDSGKLNWSCGKPGVNLGTPMGPGFEDGFESDFQSDFKLGFEVGFEVHSGLILGLD